MNKTLIHDLEENIVQNNYANIMENITKYSKQFGIILKNPNNVVIKLVENENINIERKKILMNILMMYNVFLNSVNKNGQYPLHICVMKGYVDLIPIFLHQYDYVDNYSKIPIEYVSTESLNQLFIKLKRIDDIDISELEKNISPFIKKYDGLGYSISWADIFMKEDVIEYVNKSLVKVSEYVEAIHNTQTYGSIKEKEKYIPEYTNIDDISDYFWRNIYKENLQDIDYNFVVHDILDRYPDIINPIRNAITFGYLSNINTDINNLVNMNEDDIVNVLGRIDNICVHRKAILPRYNIIDFENKFFMKGDNYLEIYPCKPVYLDLNYNSFITQYIYYDFKNWFVLKLFRRYNKNVQRICDHFTKTLPEYGPIINRTKFLCWNELFWFLISLPFDYTNKDRYKVDGDENYTKLVSGSDEDTPPENRTSYSDTEIDGFLKLYDDNNGMKRNYLIITFGMEIVLLYRCLLQNNYSKKLSDVDIMHDFSFYNKSVKNMYLSQRSDPYISKILNYNISNERKESSFKNMNSLLRDVSDGICVINDVRRSIFQITIKSSNT
jgi:hypothetical protein